MYKRWTNWMRQVVLRTSAPRLASRYRPLNVEQCECRLALSAWFPSAHAEGGFIDIYANRFNAYDGPSPGGDAGRVQPSWVTTNIGLQQPKVAMIVADELAGTEQEGGLIDLTLVDRETNLVATSLPLVEKAVFEDIPFVADMPDVSVPAMPDVSSRFVPSIREPAASVQVPSMENVAPDSFVPVSLTIPTEERIDGTQGRVQVFDLAIRTPASTTALRTCATVEPLGSDPPTPVRPAQASAPVTERSGVEPSDDLTEAAPDREPPVPSRAIVAESRPGELVDLPDAAERELETFPVGVDHDRSIRDRIFSHTEHFLLRDWYGEVPNSAADLAEDLVDGVPTDDGCDELSWVIEPRAEAAHPVGDIAESSFAGNSSVSQAPAADDTVSDRTDAARRETQNTETNTVEKKTDLDRGDANVSGSSQKPSIGEAGNSELSAACGHSKPGQAQKVDAVDDRAEQVKTADVQRPPQLSAVLAAGVAGHYLGTRRRHRSIEGPQSLGDRVVIAFRSRPPYLFVPF